MIVIVLNFLFYKLSLNNKVFKIVYKIKNINQMCFIVFLGMNLKTNLKVGKYKKTLINCLNYFQNKIYVTKAVNRCHE